MEDIKSVESLDEFKSLISSEKLLAVVFWTHWSDPSKQMVKIAGELSKQLSNIKFIKVEAEESSNISDHCEVENVPITLIYKDGKEIDRIIGSDVPEFTKRLTAINSGEDISQVDQKKMLYDRLRNLINSSKVMAFIKGTKTNPQCGFTRQLLEILNETGVEYNTFNILTSPEVRQGLKEYSNWPTYPQLYVDGELIGGVDIVKELKAEGELLSTLKGSQN